MVIDNRLSFKEHLTYISGKCAATSYALARIMPNLGGPKLKRRLILMKVVTSTAKYSAPIWAGAMNKMIYRIGIEAAYRSSVLRVISAFRTVLTDAALVIAGMVSLALIVERRKRNTRRGIDLSNPVQLVDDAMKKRQQDWANSYKGR